ncbi:MAG TPA: YhjD/YihY/BrkB family envelope integrity protein [Desulfatiglandales bacterium]|nr:YhjD/YihY/BrkB family envelope integrity protein [Desulfatiglandales bacterium]
MDSRKFISSTTAKTTEAIRFLRGDIWRIREKDLPRRKSILLRSLRVIVLSVRGISSERAGLRASALTFYSLLSVVPVAAMVFGIAKGFGFENSLEGLLMSSLEGQEEIVKKIVDFAHALLEDVKGGFIAGLGLLILFYTIIKILSNIENALNEIWGIKKPRSLSRKITDYLSVMLIGPVLFFMSSTLTVYISGSVRQIIEGTSVLRVVSPGISFLLQFLPYISLWFLFSFVYIFIPNTKIKWSSGILGGIIAGSLYHIFQFFYISLQIGVAKYNAIYGGFAALPLFFIWMQTGWLIVLFGAEMAFAHQNVETYEFEQECLTVSHAFKKLLSLRILHLIVRDFWRGGKPYTSRQIAHDLEIPIRLVNEILFELVASGLASEVKTDEGRGIAYEPAKDPDAMTIKNVIDMLEQHGSDDIPVAQTEELRQLSESLKTFSDVIEKTEANRKLKEICC